MTDALRLNFGFRSVKSKNEANTIVGDVKTGSDRGRRTVPAAGRSELDADRRARSVCLRREERSHVREQRHVRSVQHHRRRLQRHRTRWNPKPSTNYEPGLRLRGSTFDALIAAYHVDFEDRLLGITQGPGIVGQSAGARQCRQRKTNGVEAGVDLAADADLSWFTSLGMERFRV